MPDHQDYAPSEEDRMMVSAIVAGDRHAFKTLIHKYEKLVVNIVFRMVSQRQDQEDLCQDIFMAVYDKIDRFRYQSKLSTWIGNIAFNRCANFLQKRKIVFMEDLKGRRTSEEDVSVDHTVSGIAGDTLHPEDIFLRKELQLKISDALERLPIIQKTVITLFHQMEFSLEEIAAITSLPVNTVKSHLFRGRKALKIQLENF